MLTFQTLKDELQQLSFDVQPSLMNKTITAEKQHIKGNNKAANALSLTLKKDIEKIPLKKKYSQTENENILRIVTMIDILIKNTN